MEFGLLRETDIIFQQRGWAQPPQLRIGYFQTKLFSIGVCVQLRMVSGYRTVTFRMPYLYILSTGRKFLQFSQAVYNI